MGGIWVKVINFPSFSASRFPQVSKEKFSPVGRFENKALF